MRRMGLPGSLGLPRAAAADPPRPPAPPPLAAAGAELLGALRVWSEACDAGAAALDRGDTDALARALEARETLRPPIQALTSRVRSAPEAPEGLLAEIARAAAHAAAREVTLVQRMEAERIRLRREVDSLGRGNAPMAAYRRPDPPDPHRLDILR